MKTKLFRELQRMDHYIVEVPRSYENGISFRVDSKHLLLMLFPQCDPGR